MYKGQRIFRWLPVIIAGLSLAIGMIVMTYYFWLGAKVVHSRPADSSPKSMEVVTETTNGSYNCQNDPNYGAPCTTMSQKKGFFVCNEAGDGMICK